MIAVINRAAIIYNEFPVLVVKTPSAVIFTDKFYVAFYCDRRQKGKCFFDQFPMIVFRSTKCQIHRALVLFRIRDGLKCFIMIQNQIKKSFRLKFF